MTDPVLLITGASSGIGSETARRASEAGYRLALAARSVDKLNALVDELGGADRALAISCDVQSEDDQKAMVAAVIAAYGQLDAVFANAGRGGSPGGFSAASPADWKDMILTNIYGVGLTVQQCIPHLRKSRGQLLITSSVAGTVTVAGSMYSASKWAVSAIGRGVREELRGSGIRVTLIQPGFVDTDFFDVRPESALQPTDVANAVLYALSQPAHVDVNEILVCPTSPLA